MLRDVLMIDRLVLYLTMLSKLRKAGVTTMSALCYPLLRRVGRRENRLVLRNGLEFVAPRSEPLVPIFLEIWRDRLYDTLASEDDVMTVVDIGAHAGVFAAWAATRYPAARVLSFEPSPVMYEYLRRNVEENHLERVTTRRAAVAGRPGAVRLNRRGAEAMNTIYATDLYGSEFVDGVDVEAVTLASIFDEYGVGRCDLLKLDCEGAEYEIIFSAPPEVLARVLRVTMEYHLGLNDHDAESMARFLRDRGFSVRVDEPVDVEGGYLYASRDGNR